MSTQETRASLNYARGHRRVQGSIIIDLNLNQNLGLPSVRNQEPDSTRLFDSPVPLPSPIVQATALRSISNSISPPNPIDFQEFDNEVLISSPREFEEARTRRNIERVIVVDDDAEHPSSSVIANARSKRKRVARNQTIVNSDLYINLEDSGSSSSVRENVVQSVAPPPPPPPVKEPTFNCPVCMSPFIEAASTKCGHIFCKSCIKAAIAVQNKCPTCRKRITMRGVIRVYLPTAE